MQNLEGRGAVITGGASGIGRALARVCGEAGMRVAIADVEAAALQNARTELQAAGITCAAFQCDVGEAQAVQQLAADARAALGGVHLVCNNAGVFAGGTAWGTALADYEWQLRVNVWGVIHGIRAFAPPLMEQSARGEAGHVVNVASMAGITSGPLTAAYTMSKHAVVSLSESLHFDLAAHNMDGGNAGVGVSVVCPELVQTGIAAAGRNRPPQFARAAADALPPETTQVERALQQACEGGLAPAVIAKRTLAAVRAGRFWVLPPDGDPWRAAAARRCTDINTARNPEYEAPRPVSAQ